MTDKLDPAKIHGKKEAIMARAVAETLQDFCRQDKEFEQAVEQGGSFQDCMTAVAKGCGNAISDIDAYRKAVKFYFPGAEIRMQMTIDLIGAAAGEKPVTEGAIVLDLEDFL